MLLQIIRSSDEEEEAQDEATLDEVEVVAAVFQKVFSCVWNMGHHLCFYLDMVIRAKTVSFFLFRFSAS